MDSFVYRTLLRYLLEPAIESINIAMGPKMTIFQQDNVSIHKARIIKNYFRRHNIVVMEDLNPIEHTWVELKRRLHRKYPHLSDTSGGPVKVREQLAIILPEI